MEFPDLKRSLEYISIVNSNIRVDIAHIYRLISLIYMSAHLTSRVKHRGNPSNLLIITICFVSLSVDSLNTRVGGFKG